MFKIQAKVELFLKLFFFTIRSDNKFAIFVIISHKIYQGLFNR